jgi:mono/diheme cytochrome c family protein
MGIKRTVLPWIVFTIGLCGLGGGLLLQWWTNAYNWPWIVSGKPFFSLPANIPVTFETTILASVFASFFGMWILNKLPQVWHPFFRKDRFLKATDDSFFIGIQAADKKFQRGKTEAILRDAGALEVEPCYTSAAPDRRRLPRPLTAFILVSTVLALVPLALVAKARTTKSAEPHIHVFPDMDFQPKFGAQDATLLFDNMRASRVPVEGTVARGQLKSDDQFYRGINNGEWTTAFPATFEVSERTMARGKERYTIYCQPCHGSSGKGDGMIHERTKQLAPGNRAVWVQPTSLHQDYVVRLPHGQLFNTISHGIRTMPAYAAQIPEWDRWAIVLYVRALQRSQRANLDDVPPDARSAIQ